MPISTSFFGHKGVSGIEVGLLDPSWQLVGDWETYKERAGGLGDHTGDVTYDTYKGSDAIMLQYHSNALIFRQKLYGGYL